MSDLLLCFYLLATRRMEKLVKLLNEFNKENIPEEFKEILPDEIEYVFWDYFLTKKAGFIERLVENDKIKSDEYCFQPRKDLVKEIAIVDYKTGKAIWCKNLYSESEQLIMYLSIQDNPLDYLVSILK